MLFLDKTFKIKDIVEIILRCETTFDRLWVVTQEGMLDYSFNMSCWFGDIDYKETLSKAVEGITYSKEHNALILTTDNVKIESEEKEKEDVEIY